MTDGKKLRWIAALGVVLLLAASAGLGEAVIAAGHVPTGAAMGAFILAVLGGAILAVALMPRRRRSCA